MAGIDVDDLLSGDDDSNDSFFEDPKVLAKRNSLPKTNKKKNVADLFGFGEEKEEIKPDDSDQLDLRDITHKKANKVNFEENADVIPADAEGNVFGKREGQKRDKNYDIENDEILSSFGFSKNITKATDNNPAVVKSTGLFNDILMGTSSPKRERQNFTNILTDDERKSKTNENKETSQPPMTSSESRRSRTNITTSSTADPLGLFSRKTVETGESATILPQPKSKPAQTIRSAPNITQLPDWLLSNSSASTIIKQHKSEPDISSIAEEKPKTTEETLLETPVLNKLIAQQKLSAVNVGLQNSVMAMQQQESKVNVALQLKEYEEKLIEMQKHQQEILVKQDQQFNDLLQKQFLRQQALEENIRQQQQRIQNHIELLIHQPGVVNAERIGDLRKSKEDESVQLYESIIGTLKQRHHEEMFLLEESYKKQITMLEEGMQSLESRLRTELEIAVETYQKKLKQTDEYYKEEISKYKEKLEQMSEQQANEIKLIHDNHLRVVAEINNEYMLLTENLKQTKSTESILMADASEYTEKLDKSLSILDVNSRALLEIQNTVEKNTGIFYATREESIKAKEEEIKIMRKTLEKARESAETERAQLMGLVRTLEMKIVEQNQNAREEHWALQQATATLTAKASALDREADYNRSNLEREREQIKLLKESILAEQERNMLILTEQRLALEAEKSRLETIAKLNKNCDSQIVKAEIEAAVQVAKEAAELTDQEREKLQRQQYELASIKRNLLDKEKKITLKERELDVLVQEAETKIRESERAMDSAKMLEIKYNERVKDLQNQMASLASREKKLTEEKIDLSRERLMLHTLMRQNRKCGLCTAVGNNNHTRNEENVVESDMHNFNMTANDSDIYRFRLETGECINDDLLIVSSNNKVD